MAFLQPKLVFLSAGRNSCKSGRIDLDAGPIVVAMTQERTYWPFAAAGLALTIAVIRVSKFC